MGNPTAGLARHGLLTALTCFRLPERFRVVYNKKRKSRRDQLTKKSGNSGEWGKMKAAGSVTRLLTAIKNRETGAWDTLLAAVYGELRDLAARQMRVASDRHTLQPTALVHEAYLRLFGHKEPQWRNKADFFAAAAEAMRRILVDHARRRAAQKRGGRPPEATTEARQARAIPPDEFPDLAENVEALDLALARFERDEQHADKCTMVKLRYFAGLTIEQTAQALGKSEATVKRDWAFAKAWLYREITKGER